jgi:hypothetical protein
VQGVLIDERAQALIARAAGELGTEPAGLLALDEVQRRGGRGVVKDLRAKGELLQGLDCIP